MTKKRLLVVMHSTNVIYGAGRSLFTWLIDSNVDFDLIIPKSLIFKDNKRNLEFFLKYTSNVRMEWIPFDLCFEGRDGASLRGRIYYFFRNALSFLNKRHLQEIIKEYDVVYLNSLVLWQLIEDNNNTFIHIREIYKGTDSKKKLLEDKLMKAKGCIFIDNTTLKEFENLNINRTVLVNPFDMRNVKDYPQEEIKKKYEIDHNKVVFSVIGRVLENKGVDFIIKAFIKANMLHSILLIVGEGHGSYYNKCRHLAQGKDDRVVFIQETKDIEQIYAISDYIIRGEKVFCIGRTIYEGLYSGLMAIIPGSQEDIKYMDNIDGLQKKVIFYAARDINQLKSIFQHYDGKSVVNRDYRGNVYEYRKNILNFMGVTTNEI